MGSTRIYKSPPVDGNFQNTANWSAGVAPVSTDSAILPPMAAGTVIVGDGTHDDESAVALANLTVEPGCFLNMGSRLSRMIFTATNVQFEGNGYSFLDIRTCASMLVENVGSPPAGGSFGMDLIGATIAYLRLDPGNGKSVGVAAGATETATVTTLDALSGTITLGQGLASTTINSSSPLLYSYASPTTFNQIGGIAYILGGSPGTLNVASGTCFVATGTAIGAASVTGGVLDLTRNQAARITALSMTGGTLRALPGQLDGMTLTSIKGGNIQIAS
jgi:hypothetical protein